jgi:hypothetical protein
MVICIWKGEEYSLLQEHNVAVGSNTVIQSFGQLEWKMHNILIDFPIISGGQTHPLYLCVYWGHVDDEDDPRWYHQGK